MSDSLRVKICGITQVQQALEIVSMGAQSLGFICVERSPRFVQAEKIAEIVDAVRHAYGDRIQTVGVFADAAAEVLERTVTTSGLTSIQLHGQESPESCGQIRSTFPAHELIKAFRVKDAETLRGVALYDEVVDTFLLDAYHPQELGGTGHAWDWSLLKNYRFERPWLLAGGLNPNNVSDAIAACEPNGIDLSSGVEISPGLKDLDKVKALFSELKTRIKE